MSDDQPTLDPTPNPDPSSGNDSGGSGFIPPAGSPARMPKQIGKYRIKKLIGQGGMGAVYQAVQEKPRRNVAIKLMKSGVASSSALRRFEYESQLLARLRHPGIAEVYDAGTHEAHDGSVPYFVMEYIPGAKRITDYVRDKKLSTHDRLNLFLEVASAVHHGHTKGIIHRDLKPDNIIVDSHGRVKVIDFGVARATDSDLAVTTLQTDIGQLIGTVQYMSPEQVEAEPDDLDTRSDVYSLGVVLYEILCGKLPYDVSKMKIYDATRVVRDQEAMRLSTVDSTLRGDVETITLKALEKDRERRYQTAEALSADIERYLNNEPIMAHPPSVTYQLSVFARRNKGVMTAAAAIFAALLIGVIASTYLWRDAADARDVARDNQAKAEAAQLETETARAAEAEQRKLVAAERDRAETEAASAKAIADFLFEDIIAEADPSVQPDRNITLRAVLNKATDRLAEQNFEGTPLTEASLKLKIGQTFAGLGESGKAIVLVDRAYTLRLEHLGEENLDTLAAMEILSKFNQIAFDGQQKEIPLHQTLFDIRKRILGPDHPDTLRAQNKLITRTRAAFITKYKDEGFPADHPLSPLESALAEYEELTRILKSQQTQLGAEHPDCIETMAALAGYLRNLNQLEASTDLYTQVYELNNKTLGEKHPETLYSMLAVAQNHKLAGREEESYALRVKTRELMIVVLGDRHGLTQYQTNTMIEYLRSNERWDEMAPLVQWMVTTNTDILSIEEMRLGILYAWLDDRDAHENASRAFIIKHALTQDSNDAERAAKSVLVMGDDIAPDLLALAASQAYKATRYINEDNEHLANWFALTHGMGHYRTGKYEAAAAKFIEAQAINPSMPYRTSLPWLAMAQYRLGNIKEARELLTQAHEAIDTPEIGTKQTWHNFLVAKMALREAEALINPAPQ